MNLNFLTVILLASLVLLAQNEVSASSNSTTKVRANPQIRIKEFRARNSKAQVEIAVENDNASVTGADEEIVYEGSVGGSSSVMLGPAAQLIQFCLFNSKGD